MARAIVKAWPQPVSMSTSSGRSQTSVMRPIIPGFSSIGASVTPLRFSQAARKCAASEKISLAEMMPTTWPPFITGNWATPSSRPLLRQCSMVSSASMVAASTDIAGSRIRSEKSSSDRATARSAPRAAARTARAARTASRRSRPPPTPPTPTPPTWSAPSRWSPRTATCAKCHEGATENFPAAWLSHYEPTLEKAPLVWLVKVGYMILIPFMIGGLCLQILLHLWRVVVNR